MAKRKQTEYYVNNKEFLAAIVEYRNKVHNAKELSEDRPRVTNYLGECFLKIATHLSYKPNFVNYMFREDMICDGIENCLQYIDNFDPEKSKNPFSYFTQIIYYAFLRRIEKEKKQSYVKYKAMELSDDGSLSNWYKSNYFDKENVRQALSQHFDLNENDLKKFEPKKKKKKKKKGLDSVMDKPDEDSTAE